MPCLRLFQQCMSRYGLSPNYTIRTCSLLLEMEQNTRHLDSSYILILFHCFSPLELSCTNWWSKNVPSFRNSDMWRHYNEEGYHRLNLCEGMQHVDHHFTGSGITIFTAVKECSTNTISLSCFPPLCLFLCSSVLLNLKDVYVNW